MDISSRVEYANDYLANRLGKTIIYKRYWVVQGLPNNIF